MNRKQIVKIVGACIIGGVGLAFFTNALFKIHIGGIFAAEPEAGAALSYIGALLGSIGTITLGWIAYKQNEKLQAMEDNNFIASNSSMIVINRIQVKKVAGIPVNYNIHSEQILREVKCDEFYPAGYEFAVEASALGTAIPSMLHAVDGKLILTDKGEEVANAFLENEIECFSRIAVLKDSIKFSITVCLSKETRLKFESAITNGSPDLLIEFKFQTVTDKYVATTCQCRSYGTYLDDNKVVTWYIKEPMVFFYGHELLDRRKIKIAGEDNRNE